MPRRSRRTPLRACALAAAVLASAGCAGEEPTPAPSSTTATSTPRSTPETVTQSPAAGPSSATFTMAFAGDVHFERRLRTLLDEPATSLAELRETLGAADFSMVNLETALTTRGAPIDKAYTFRAPPKALDALAAAGVDAVSMANNHAVDYGLEGLSESLRHKRSGNLPIVGIGADATEAFTPHVVEIEGVEVAVLASMQQVEPTSALYSAAEGKPGVAANLDMTRLRAAVRKATAEHDLVVVMMHWGTEGKSCPDERQLRPMRALTEDGADVIVGTHAHRIQGAGWNGSTFVGYGLGNFVFYRSDEPSSRSGVLTLTVDAQRARAPRGTDGRRVRPPVVDMAWTPLLTRSDGVPRKPSRADQARLMRVWQDANACSGLDQSPT